MHHQIQVIITHGSRQAARAQVGLGIRRRLISSRSVDSDTIWAADVAERVCEPFADPWIWGVGTRQNVYNPTAFLQKVNDIYLDYRLLRRERRADRVRARRLLPLGAHGGLPAILPCRRRRRVPRRVVCRKALQLGRRQASHHAPVGPGWSTYMQRSARVWSTFPSKPREFLNQRLRWGRNTWRSDLRALKERWVFRYPFLTFTLLDKAMSSFTLLLSPLWFTFAIISGNFVFAATLFAWWMVSRGAKLAAHFRRRPIDILILPAFVGLTFVMAL